MGFLAALFGKKPSEREGKKPPPPAAPEPRASGPSSYVDSGSVIASLRELYCPHNKDWRECDECKRTGWKPGDPK